MIQRLQEVLALIRQNILAYYPRKSLIFFTEWIAYLFALIFLLLSFFSYDIMSDFLDFEDEGLASFSAANFDSKYFQLKLIILGIHIVVALIFYFFARHFRAHRHFRTNVKIAERKLDAIIEEHNKVMNEID